MFDNALDFIGKKLSQGLSSAEGGLEDAVHAVGHLFSGGSSSGPINNQSSQGSPLSSGQSLNLNLNNSNPLAAAQNQAKAQAAQSSQPGQTQSNPLKLNLSSPAPPPPAPGLLKPTLFNNIKTTPLPGASGVPQGPPVNNAATQFLSGVGNVAGGIVQGAAKIGGIGVEDARALAGFATGNEAAGQAAFHRAGQDISTLGQFAQSIPRAPIQLGLTASNAPIDVKATNPVSQFLIGKQPVVSLQKTAQQAGGGPKGLGTALATGATDVATLAPFLTKGVSIVKGGEAPKIADPDIAKAADQINPAAPAEPVKPTTITPEQQSLYNTAPPIRDQRSGAAITPDMITDKDRTEASYSSTTPEELVGRRQAGLRSVDAERAALDVLQNNGTRDDAINAYRQITGESPRMAAYRVQTAARQAEQALHPNAEGINPLQGTQDIPQPKDGDYRGVQINANKVEGRIESANKDVQSFRSALTPNDKANFRDYVEGTRDINTADDPRTVEAAVKASKNLTDTVHAIDPLRPRYIKDFFPNKWDVQPDPLKAEQQLEEEMGPVAWNSMSLEDRRQALAERTEQPLGGETNYNSDSERGFHSQARVFANAKEGEAAGFKHLNEDPFDDLQRYATGAKLDMKAKIVRRSADAADSSQAIKKGANNTIDLGSGKSIKVSGRGYRALRGMDIKDSRGPVAKAWQGLTSAITQFIVLNPAIHGANLGVQGFIEAGKQPLVNAEGLLGKIPSGPVGGVRYIGNTVRLLVDRAARDKATARYLSDGGHIPSYGKDSKSIISEGLDELNLPHLNKVNATAMSKIDGLFRASRHDENLRMGVDPDTSVRSIDNFMGDQRAVPEVAKNTGLFYHWLRTEANAIVHTALSPGALTNTYVLLAVMYGLNKAWQSWNGNQNAHLRLPGDLGLLKEGYDIATKHDAKSITAPITNHVNPLITAGVNQRYGQDLFTGQQLKTPKQRANDALTTLVAPATGISKVMSGKKSSAENALNLFGFYTPHAPGAPAIPNTNNPLAAVVNTQGAKPVQTGNDPTGYSQEINWYQARDKATNSLDPVKDKQTVDQLNAYLNRNHTDTGQSIQQNPAQGIANYKSLFANDKLRNAVQQLEKSQPNHDPMWDLSSGQLKTYVDYESQYSGDPERTRMEEQQPWIAQFSQQRSDWYNQQSFSGNSVADPWDKANPYPKLDPQTTADMAFYNGITDSKEKSSFLSSHQDILDAFTQLADYNNSRRIAQGALPLETYPAESANVKAILASMPQGDDKASKKARALLIQNNPEVNQYLADVSLYDVTKNLAGYYLAIAPNQSIGQELNTGGTKGQQTLKDVSSLGAYDVGKNAAGQYQFLGGGGTGSFSPGFQSASGAGSSKFKSGSSHKIIPLPKRQKVHTVKLRRAPRQRTRVKLAKSQRRLNVKPTATIQPVNVTKPTGVVKIAG